jgi:hypothetical protein
MQGVVRGKESYVNGAIVPGRMTARIDGDFVVFLIGARINRVTAVRSWLPVVRAMPRMIAELHANPSLGLLGMQTARTSWRDILMVQYWRSFAHLHAYARDRAAEHLPAWAEYNRLLRNNDAVGIWHETFLVRAGEYEAIYGNLPARGLGLVGTLEPAAGARNSALGRLGRGAGSDLPVTREGVLESV